MVDVEYYNSLQWILNNEVRPLLTNAYGALRLNSTFINTLVLFTCQNVGETLGLTWTVEEEDTEGKVRVHE